MHGNRCVDLKTTIKKKEMKSTLDHNLYFYSYVNRNISVKKKKEIVTLIVK
jgi:hypothetical protein